MKKFLLVLAAAVGFGLLVGNSLKSCIVNATAHTDQLLQKEGL